jgi:hypothetical protein
MLVLYDPCSMEEDENVPSLSSAVNCLLFLQLFTSQPATCCAVTEWVLSYCLPSYSVRVQAVAPSSVERTLNALLLLLTNEASGPPSSMRKTPESASLGLASLGQGSPAICLLVEKGKGFKQTSAMNFFDVERT